MARPGEHMSTFFTADLHIGHANILKHCQRPFASPDEMHGFLMSAWNETVSAADTVYVLGDFSFVGSTRVPMVEAVLASLVGRKILIRGNHDSDGLQGWDEVHDFLVIKEGNRLVTLFHYPLRDWPGMWNGGIHLYGHVHGNQEPLPGSMDVGVDVWGGRPVTLDEIERAVRPFAKPADTAPFRVQSW